MAGPGLSGRRGSVSQEKNGTWTFVVDTTDVGSAARRQTRRRGFATRRAAQAALTKTIRDLDNRTYVAPVATDLRTYLEQTWLPAMRPTVRPSTFDSYARVLRLHVISKSIGARPLQSVDAPTLNALYADLLVGTDRRELSPRSVAYVHTILHRAFRDAVRWQILARNPAADADPPRARPNDRIRNRTWTAVEVATFLNATGETRHAALWRLLATTGMRRGEALGLRWSDVDLNQARLSIHRTLIQTGDYTGADKASAGGHRRRRADTGRSRSTPTLSRNSELIGRDNCRNGCGRARRTSMRNLSSAVRTAAPCTRRSCRTCSARRGTPQHAVPLAARAAAYVGDAGTAGRRAPKGGAGAARPLDDRHHDGYLQSRQPGDGRDGC